MIFIRFNPSSKKKNFFSFRFKYFAYMFHSYLIFANFWKCKPRDRLFNGVAIERLILCSIRENFLGTGYERRGFRRTKN